MNSGQPNAQATGFNMATGIIAPTVGGETPPAPGIIGPSGSPAGPSALGGSILAPPAGGSIIGPSGSPAGSSSVIGANGSPSGGGSVIGPSGSPAGATPTGGTPGRFASPQVNGQGNNATNSSLFPSRAAGSPGSRQLFPRVQSVGSPPLSNGAAPGGPSRSPGAGSGATPNTIGPSATPNTTGPSAVPNTNGPSATPNSAGPSATPNVGGGASPSGK